MTKFIQMAPSFRMEIFLATIYRAKGGLSMKNINWNDFKTTLIEHDKHYLFTFEEIEKEAHFFVFIHNFGIFDLYDSRKRKKRRSKTK